MKQLFFSVVEHVHWCRRELGLSLNHLVNGIKQISLGNHFSSCADGKHPGFGAHGANVGSRRIGAESSQQFESNVLLTVHASRMNLENIGTSLQIGQSKLNLAIQSTRSHKRRIQNVWSIGRHQDFDISTCLESIELIDNLKHRSLHFIVTASAVFEARSSNCINFIEEDDCAL